MKKKIIVLSCLAILSQQIHADNFGAAFGGSMVGSTFGSMIGSSISNRSQEPIDPYYRRDKYLADQEIQEIKYQNRIREQEERERRRQQREEEREEREEQKRRDRAKRENKKNKKYKKDNLPSTNKSHLELEIKKLEMELAKLQLLLQNNNE